MTLETPFHDRLVWDTAAGEIRDGEVRYLMIRPDTLMGLFALLDEEGRRAALAALERSTAEHGRRSAERYRALGAADARGLVATIEATAPAIGWGLWRITSAEGSVLGLKVRNSPFAAGYGPSGEPVCAPIAGMFRAVAGLILGRLVEVRERACAATGAPACRFTAGEG